MQLLVRISFLLILSTFCRIVFYGFNFSLFPSVGFMPFLMGVRFDASIVAWGSFSLVFFAILQSVFNDNKFFKVLNAIYFHVFVFVILLINFIDIGMYRFTFSRFSVDTLSFLFHGNDMANVVPMAIRDYWFLALLLIVVVFGFIKNEGKLQKLTHWRKWQLLIYIPLILVLIVSARGGTQLKPITIIDASLYIDAENVPVTLNSPFSLFTTLVEGDEAEPDVMDFEEAEQLFQLEKSIKPFKKFTSKNVVVLIMESFGKEYLDAGYMPFLDSLKNEGLYFENAYANGKRSIDAVPSILASIPDLGLKSFIYSKYAGSNINSLPKELKEKGYTTAFFHGGRNGTMSFDKFAYLCGFDQYYGFNEYPNKEDYDGTWGIYDEPFLMNFKKELDAYSKSGKPFFTTFFSLSSHHPFALPEQYEGKFNEGTHPIHKTLQYSDMALRKFFEAASKEKWYKNTVFIITADHTSVPQMPFYNTALGMYRIPLLFVDPSNPALAIKRVDLAQQVDIFPTTLSYLGVKTKVKSFGRNLLEKTVSPVIVNRSSGVFNFYSDSVMVKSSPLEIKGVYSIKDSLMLRNELGNQESEKYLKMIQARFQVYKYSLECNSYNVN